MGVSEMVTVSTDPQDARNAVELARRSADVHATAGLHPHDASAMNERTLAQLEVLAEEPEVVAIGETGLDYHYDNAPREQQRRSFRLQLDNPLGTLVSPTAPAEYKPAPPAATAPTSVSSPHCAYGIALSAGSRNNQLTVI